jgi:hypothetical protein
MRTMLLVMLAIAISVKAPHTALAQGGVVLLDVTALRSLRRDAVVRLSIDGQHSVGRFDRVTTDSLYLMATTLAVASVDSVWVRGRNTRRGAVTGAIAMGIPFTLLGILASTGWCEPPGGCDRQPELIPLGAAVGVVAGAVLGAGLGSLGHFWRRLHP